MHVGHWSAYGCSRSQGVLQDEARSTRERLAAVQEQLSAVRVQLNGGAHGECSDSGDLAGLAADIAALQQRYKEASHALTKERAGLKELSGAKARAECAPLTTAAFRMISMSSPLQ